VNGQSGYFERSLAAYGREGKECPRCGAQIRRDPFMNRSSYTCPQCQPSVGPVSAQPGQPVRLTRKNHIQSRGCPLNLTRKHEGGTLVVVNCA
jgi:hypothetical protein